ncbi:hypothetical protein [Fretibacter rubidus]
MLFSTDGTSNKAFVFLAASSALVFQPL